MIDGHEANPFIITARIEERLLEEHDAFILEQITPYCERQLGYKIEKTDLKRALTNYAPRPVLRIKHHGTLADCPTCHRLLDQEEYPIACGFCGQRLNWEEEEQE